MTTISELDKALTGIFKDFAALAQTLEFVVICDLSDEIRIAELHYPGVYKIDIRRSGDHATFKDLAKWFCSEWVTDEYERKHVPNPKKKRLNAHRELGDWIPLYIGRSRDIAGRISGHIHLSLEQPTTALKLKARANMASQCFRLSTIHLAVENYDLIMPQVERALRDRHNPILGRQ